MRQRMSSTMCGALVFAGLASLALACSGATEPHVALGAVPLTPPARFALWWRLTEACSGLTGDYASVQWYVVPNTTTINDQGTQVDAYWISDPDRIVLADAHKNDGPIVRHEMLHALLHRNGHPRDAYLVGCGDVVACDGKCALEAGVYASPAESAPVLQPKEVSTRVDVISPLPNESVDSGAVDVMITVTNPRAVPVWVQLAPRESGDLQYPTFGLVADYGDTARVAALATEWSTANRFPLDAGASRHWVWEGALGRGQFGILGYFNADSLPRRVISIGP